MAMDFGNMNLGNIGGQNTGDLMKHLEGLKFPVDKQEILDQVKQSDNPQAQQAAAFFEKLPNKQYQNQEEVMQEAAGQQNDQQDN